MYRVFSELLASCGGLLLEMMRKTWSPGNLLKLFDAELSARQTHQQSAGKWMVCILKALIGLTLKNKLMNIKKKCEFKKIWIFPLFIFSLVSFYFDNGLIILFLRTLVLHVRSAIIKHQKCRWAHSKGLMSLLFRRTGHINDDFKAYWACDGLSPNVTD